MYDKVRAHREALKQAWFSYNHSQTKEVRRIVVRMDKYPDRVGMGVVKIECDTANSYSSFSTHQENPFLWLSERPEFLSGEYELIIK